MTIVLAVGVTRGWRSAITGTLLATALLIVLVLSFGPSLQIIPIRKLQLFVGVLLLLFGMSWLRKAILRAAGVLSLHDQATIFAHQAAALRLSQTVRNKAFDTAGLITSLKAVLIEGLEVVFIVITVGATGHMLLPASLGALAAGLLVVLLGLVLHRPLTRVPENGLKLSVGILLSSFGVFWIGEGLRLSWIAHDWIIIGLVISFFIAALGAVRVVKSQARVQRR
ncbi:MAG TPA: hypothetical protein VGM27_27360 [Acidobacteriaceae bacterium]